jgi:hypothetical protein
MRVRFPDGYILEADFLPSERIHSLVDLLMKVLARPDLPFYLCKFCFSFRDDVECKYHVFLFLLSSFTIDHSFVFYHFWQKNMVEILASRETVN